MASHVLASPARTPGGQLRHGWNGDALDRFLRNCQHDPITGCVLWTGGTTAGRGHFSLYGSFWYDRARWLAHRWAAEHIHGFDIGGLQVHHCCPAYRAGDWLAPNTLCVEHVQPIPAALNRELQTYERRAAAAQTIDERRHWVHVQCGLIDAPVPVPDEIDGVPFYVAPAWLTKA